MQRITVVGRDDPHQVPASAAFLRQVAHAPAVNLTYYRQGGAFGNAILETQLTEAWLAQCRWTRLVLFNGDAHQLDFLRRILPRLPRLQTLIGACLLAELIVPLLEMVQDLRYLRILTINDQTDGTLAPNPRPLIVLPPHTPDLVLPAGLVQLTLTRANLSTDVATWVTRAVCRHTPATLFSLNLGFLTHFASDELLPEVIGAVCAGLLHVRFPLQLNLVGLERAVTCSQLCNLFHLCHMNRQVTYTLKQCPLGLLGASLHARYLQELCPNQNVWNFDGLLRPNDEVGFAMPIMPFWDMMTHRANHCYRLLLKMNHLTDPQQIIAMVEQAPSLRELDIGLNPLNLHFSHVQTLLQMWTGDIQLTSLICGPVLEGPTLSEAAFIAWLLAEKWVIAEGETGPLKWPRLVTLAVHGSPALNGLLRRRTSLLMSMQWSPSDALNFTLPAFNQRIWTIMMIFQRRDRQLSLLQGGGQLPTGHNQLRFRMLPHELIFMILQYWLRRDELDEAKRAISHE